MDSCEPFLSGAPHAYFDAPLGAPCTPVEERWTRQPYNRWMCFLSQQVDVLPLTCSFNDMTWFLRKFNSQNEHSPNDCHLQKTNIELRLSWNEMTFVQTQDAKIFAVRGEIPSSIFTL